MNIEEWRAIHPNLPMLESRITRELLDKRIEDGYYYPHPTEPSAIIRYDFRSTKPKRYSWFQYRVKAWDCRLDESRPDGITLFTRLEETYMTTPLQVITLELNESILEEQRLRDVLTENIEKLKLDIETNRQKILECDHKEKQLLAAIEHIK